MPALGGQRRNRGNRLVGRAGDRQIALHQPDHLAGKRLLAHIGGGGQQPLGDFAEIARAEQGDVSRLDESRDLLFRAEPVGGIERCRERRDVFVGQRRGGPASWRKT